MLVYVEFKVVAEKGVNESQRLKEYISKIRTFKEGVYMKCIYSTSLYIQYCLCSFQAKTI